MFFKARYNKINLQLPGKTLSKNHAKYCIIIQTHIMQPQTCASARPSCYHSTPHNPSQAKASTSPALSLPFWNAQYQYDWTFHPKPQDHDSSTEPDGYRTHTKSPIDQQNQADYSSLKRQLDIPAPRAVAGAENIPPAGKRYAHSLYFCAGRGQGRANLRRRDAGSSRGVSSRLCYRMTLRSGEMYSHKGGRDVFGVFCLMLGVIGERAVAGLLHFTA